MQVYAFKKQWYNFLFYDFSWMIMYIGCTTQLIEQSIFFKDL